MSDTILTTCKICNQPMDSIPQFDDCVCDDCQEQQGREDMNYELICQKYFD